MGGRPRGGWGEQDEGGAPFKHPRSPEGWLGRGYSCPWTPAPSPMCFRAPVDGFPFPPFPHHLFFLSFFPTRPSLQRHPSQGPRPPEKEKGGGGMGGGETQILGPVPAAPLPFSTVGLFPPRLGWAPLFARMGGSPAKRPFGEGPRPGGVRKREGRAGEGRVAQNGEGPLLPPRGSPISDDAGVNTLGPRWCT